MLCSEIVHRARTRVAERGSGVSTVILARLLRELGAGTLVAVEHDRAWAALVSDLLRHEALDSVQQSSTRRCRATRCGTQLSTRCPHRSTYSSSTGPGARAWTPARPRPSPRVLRPTARIRRSRRARRSPATRRTRAARPMRSQDTLALPNQRRSQRRRRHPQLTIARATDASATRRPSTGRTLGCGGRRADPPRLVADLLDARETASSGAPPSHRSDLSS